jgi:predicted cupin superfamily sugar epimerase
MLGVTSATSVAALMIYFKSKKSTTIEDLVEKYGMSQHPEGGYFVETYRAQSTVVSDRGDTTVSRSAATAIYFLVCPGNVSRLHRIQSDELWHFYLGGPMTVIELDNSEPSGYRFFLDTFFIINNVGIF